MSKPAAELVPVAEELIQALLADLREADRLELESIRNWSAEQEVRHAIRESVSCQACVVAGKVVAIFGDTRYSDAIGLPWMASSVWVEQYRRAFLERCRLVIRDMQSRHLVLINMVDARNTLAIRWLKWLGFSFSPAVPYGIGNELFHPFHMEGAACAQ